MKKFILYSFLFLFIAGILIGGGLYYQKKDQLAELEKAGLEFLSESNVPQTAAPDESSSEKSDEKVSLPSNVTIDMQDKLAVAKIVLTKVPAEELNQFREMAAGGVTPEEKNQAIAMLKARLSKDDLDALTEIAQKYVK